VPIHIPPLRERVEDIAPLARYFLEKSCAENHKPPKQLTPKAIQKLQKYGWPGNVRELANTIERAVVLDFDPVIDAEHLYLDTEKKSVEKSMNAGITLHEMEKRLILDTLEAFHQNRTKTASVLGISVRTLRNKLHEYGLAASEEVF
jgi:two-component system response regulator AtoC